MTYAGMSRGNNNVDNFVENFCRILSRNDVLSFYHRAAYLMFCHRKIKNAARRNPRTAYLMIYIFALHFARHSAAYLFGGGSSASNTSAGQL